jgi:hypothetical protein
MIRWTTPAKMVGEVRFELTSSRSQGECLKPLGYPPTSLVLPRRIELRSLALQTSVITRPTQAAVHGGRRGLCSHRLSSANRVLS